MRLIIRIFFPIFSGCLQYCILPQKLVPNNFRLFSVVGGGESLCLLNSSNFFFMQENDSVSDKVQQPHPPRKS